MSIRHSTARSRHPALYRQLDRLPIGTVFNTPFEDGCVVASEPDRDGNFTGIDSDGVECSFNVDMVNHQLVTGNYCTACERTAEQGHAWDCPVEMGL